MRLTFRQFFELATPASAMAAAKPVLGGKLFNTGPFNFPDMSYLNAPGEAPPGGHQSFQGMVQTGLDRRFYYTNQALQTIATLVTNIYQAWAARNAGQPTTDNYHANVQFDTATHLLSNINPQELEGMGHGRLQPQQTQVGRQLGIIIADPQNPGMLAVDTRKLQKAMWDAQQQMKGSRFHMYQAGKADQALGAMSGGGMVQLSKSANPNQ